MKADNAYLLYLPHAPRQLYESLLTTNYSPLLAQKPGRVLLGNDLAEYVPGFARIGESKDEAETGNAEGEGEFVKPKKKRKGKGEQERQFKDGVLQRLGESACPVCPDNQTDDLHSAPYVCTSPHSSFARNESSRFRQSLPVTHFPLVGRGQGGSRGLG